MFDGQSFACEQRLTCVARSMRHKGRDQAKAKPAWTACATKLAKQSTEK
jgi:hypothetical protein